ncbi:hypothetical protein L9F63_014138, partial [Diploptera punctata]
GEYLFVDPDNKLSKYAPKNWRSSHAHGLDGSGKPSLMLYFRVQFYVDSPLLLRDEVTRHHYYLQLRYNVQSRGLLHANSTEDVLYVLAAYALQADVGDLEETHSQNYFNPQDYFPQQMATSGDQQLVQTVRVLHRHNHGISKSEAELQYIREASSAEVCPLTHNSHLYRLKRKKQETGQGSVWLAICAKGIEIYEENSAKSLTATFLWNNIGKLIFDRKKFEIRALNWPASGEKFTYYTNSDEKSKHLLFLCRVTHQFSMAIQPRLSEVRRKEEEERKRYRDCYMYSRGLGSDFPSLAKLAGNYKGHHSDQRISVISNTSSNTTSGIVSDRVQSLDESEDDLEIEIMINSPPAPSVESLALAHLRDAPETVPSAPSPRSHCSKGGDEGSTPPLVASQKQSPSGAGGAATPATTDGSQCSSSCSTVVVAGATLAISSSSSAPRRASTSSSLELGYSHTAQNSAVSDSASTCPELELDYSVQSAHTSSGIYTLRSSCGTTVETNACSSETSGVYAVCSTNSASYPDSTYSVMVSSARGRDRSGSSAGSVVSGSGSFRGDGSDPSDAGPRSPLTAKELSDLIVGRGSGSGHASGVYPSRATVSTTLDSDSDYVTLPPPPMPPPRTDSDKNYLLLETNSVTTTPAALVSSALSIEDEIEDIISPPPPPPYTPQALSQQNLISQQKSLAHLHSQNLEVLNQTEQTLLSQALQSHSLSPQQSIRLLSPPHHQSSLMNVSIPVEEANARFITTKPHINILTAHTSLVASTASPSFAAPTLVYQHSIGSGGASMPVSTSQQLQLYPPDPGAKMKPAPVQTLVPIIGKNNYLDVHASRSNYHQRQFSPPPPPPPVLHPRQPPPPPPSSSGQPSLATVYTSQVTRSQIEQFQQQMYSDVDYVIYPMKDPAVSKQEYMDAKQGSLIAHAAALPYPCQKLAYPPPPYPSYHSGPKSHFMYRSTPNVAVASGYLPVAYGSSTLQSAAPIKYASNQNLSSVDTLSGYPSHYLSASHYSSSTSPLYSAGTSYSSSSTRSLRCEPPVAPFSSTLGGFGRALSDDNILNSYEKPSSGQSLLERPKYRRLPPPPPPPPYDQQRREEEFLPIDITLPPLPLDSPKASAGEDEDVMLDIRTLREKSKNLDLPLISALCNDRSLLKQTNAFVMPRHPGTGVSSSGRRKSTSSKHCSYSSSKHKYPVSGLSTTQISKPVRKVSASTHTHPTHVHGSSTSVKSGQSAESQNYV